MRLETKATFDRLEQASWFSRIGEKDARNAIVLSSWHEAMDYCTSAGWRHIRLDAANRLCERLASLSEVRFQQWNDIVAEIKPISELLVARKVDAVVRESNLPKLFESCVRWDILHLFLEAEYVDVCPPGFFAGTAYWYTAGHFPCGWEHELAGGRPIIF